MWRKTKQGRWIALLAIGLALAGFAQSVESPLWAMEFPPLTGHTGTIWSVAFSPDGRLLASGSSDRKTKLWEVGTGKEVATLVGHEGSVMAVAFSPTMPLLASGSADVTVIIWDLGRIMKAG